MICSECNIAMNVKDNYYVAVNDKVYNRIVMTCRNPQCTQYNKEVNIDNEIDLRRENTND